MKATLIAGLCAAVLGASAQPASERFVLLQSAFAPGVDPAAAPASSRHRLLAAAVGDLAGPEAAFGDRILRPGFRFSAPAGPLAAPVGLALAVVDETVRLAWDPVPGAAAYVVFSSSDPWANFVADGSGSFSGESWQASLPGTLRFYRVRARR